MHYKTKRKNPKGTQYEDFKEMIICRYDDDDDDYDLLTQKISLANRIAIHNDFRKKQNTKGILLLLL